MPSPTGLKKLILLATVIFSSSALKMQIYSEFKNFWVGGAWKMALFKTTEECTMHNKWLAKPRTLTYTGRKGLVPHASVSAEAGECAATMETVTWVTGIQDERAGKVSLVLDFVAVAGHTWLPTLDQVET